MRAKHAHTCPACGHPATQRLLAQLDDGTHILLDPASRHIDPNGTITYQLRLEHPTPAHPAK